MLNDKGNICDALKQTLTEGDLVGYSIKSGWSRDVIPAIYLGECFTKKGTVRKDLPFKFLVCVPPPNNRAPWAPSRIEEKNVSSTSGIVKVSNIDQNELTEDIKKLIDYYESHKV